MAKHENVTADDLFFILSLFDRSGVLYWLDGGWGIDVLTGAQRRQHRDVDIDFDASHTAEILDLLKHNGWLAETDQLPCRAELYSPEHGYADIHPFEILSGGRARQADLNGSWWNFEPDFFTTVIFDGRRIPCISPQGQTVFHSGYEWRDKDRIDMDNLKKYAKNQAKPIIIAPCGLVCSQCDAWRATQAGDEEKLELVAADWRKLNHCDEIKAEFLHCDGCMSESRRKSAFCGMCKIRLCAVEKGVSICSECPDYPCAELTGFLANQPPEQIAAMRKMLDGIAEVEKNTHHLF